MILDFIRDNLNGDTWEKWCDDCYRDRYQADNYTKIQASHLGDAGFEGFTMNGIVYQCYCPEKYYTDNELYEHLREKVTKDIKKLISKDNAIRISKLGIHKIKEWHFVIPEYKDKRIIEHLEVKRLEVLKMKESDAATFVYIDDNIRLVIKTAEDFKEELIRLIRNPLVDIKLNAAVKSIKDVDWTTCEAEKSKNIKRKLIALMGTDEGEDFIEMLKFWSEAYLKGIEIMHELQCTCGAIYEDLFELEQQYKKDVSAQSRMNRDMSLNNTIFNEILNNFEAALADEFKCFSQPTIMELKRDLVSGWLADCSLQFKAGI